MSEEGKILAIGMEIASIIPQFIISLVWFGIEVSRHPSKLHTPCRVMNQAQILEPTPSMIGIDSINSRGSDVEPVNLVSSSISSGVAVQPRNPKRTLREGEANELTGVRYAGDIKSDDTGDILRVVECDCGFALEAETSSLAFRHKVCTGYSAIDVVNRYRFERSGGRSENILIIRNGLCKRK